MQVHVLLPTPAHQNPNKRILSASAAYVGCSYGQAPGQTHLLCTGVCCPRVEKDPTSAPELLRSGVDCTDMNLARCAMAREAEIVDRMVLAREAGPSLVPRLMIRQCDRE